MAEEVRTTLNKQKPPPSQSWENSLELVDNHYSDALPCLQDLLQPMDVIGIGISERDIVRQPRNLHGVRTVPDELIGHHDRPVQAQSLSCKGRTEDSTTALPCRAPEPTNWRIKSPGGLWDAVAAVMPSFCCSHIPPRHFTGICPIYSLLCWSPFRTVPGASGEFRTQTLAHFPKPMVGPAAAACKTAQDRGKMEEICPFPLAFVHQQVWGSLG